VIVLRTKSRQEKILATNLSPPELAASFHLVTCTRFYAGRKAMVELPLFPGYLFLRGSLDDAFPPIARSALPDYHGAQSRQIDEELTNLHMALCVNSTLIPSPI